MDRPDDLTTGQIDRYSLSRTVDRPNALYRNQLSESLDIFDTTHEVNTSGGNLVIHKPWTLVSHYGLSHLFVDGHIRSLLTYIRVFSFLLLSYTPPV